MAANYLVTFDLTDADGSTYERIYAWAHGVGGYRYFQFKDGTWGRLPSTTIVVPLNAATPIEARTAFQKLLEDAGYSPTHIAVCRGDGRSVFSSKFDARQVPDYAKRPAKVGSRS